MIAILADIAWEDLHQRPQQLAVRFARSDRVLWVEPATLGHRFVHGPLEVFPGISKTAIPMFPFNARNRHIRKTTRAVSRIPLARSLIRKLQHFLLKDALRRVLPLHDGVSFLVQNFQMMPLVETVPNSRVVFDYIDDAFGFTDLPAHVHHDWEHALDRATVLTATSPVLAARIRSVRNREVLLVPNGVEYERFAVRIQCPRPNDLPPAGKPVVGYVGSVYPWIDFSLINRTAQLMPDIEFVIIGREHPEVRDQLSKAQRNANVHVLGMRPYADIPAYLANLDAGMIPFRLTRLTEGVNPVKLYEYSAAGLTTVATNFSPDMNAFAEIVLIAHTPEEFVTHLRIAIQRRNDAERVALLGAFARQNDWDERASTLHRLLVHSS
jgi:glycosyltransferase involved in cell wall biosynthesis